MKTFLQKMFFMAVFISGARMVRAQDSVQKQIWPEMDIYYRFSERFRLYSQITGTKSNSEFSDGTAGIYLDFFAKPWLNARRNDTQLGDSTQGYYWWFRMGYSYSASPPSDKKKDVNILETETNNSFFLPAKLVLESRNRLDWRWVNGDFQPVYRPRIKFLRNFKTEYLTFNAYLWSEYFFYLNDNSQDRFRLALGSEIKVLKSLDFEIYFMHQFQNQPSVEPLHAVGLIMDLYFRSKHYH
jgi:hypothetical protein